MGTQAVTLSPGTYIVAQPPPPPDPVHITKTIIAGIQMGMFTSVWGVGRSTPVTNPPVHGSVTQTPGSPSVFNFFPARILNPAGKPASDNLYNYRALLDQVDPVLLTKATQFSNQFWLRIDNPLNSEAIELDYPTPITNGTMGLQFLPANPTTWQVRAFDFNLSKWIVLPGTSFPATLLASGVMLGGTYTCDGKNVVHTSVSINGVSIPVAYTQPCLTPRANLLLNAAFQLDATTDAKAYTVGLNKFQITFQ